MSFYMFIIYNFPQSSQSPDMTQLWAWNIYIFVVVERFTAHEGLYFSISYRYILYTDRDNACRLGSGRDSNLVLRWMLGFLPHTAGLPSFRRFFLPPSPPVFDTFLHATWNIHLLYLMVLCCGTGARTNCTELFKEINE